MMGLREDMRRTEVPDDLAGPNETARHQAGKFLSRSACSSIAQPKIPSKEQRREVAACLSRNFAKLM